uniref:Uncharacterized protein n=1 Tax=Amphimedon queenslandica TaxID=400682 RepID=A0A1X7TIR9_AMPQE
MDFFVNNVKQVLKFPPVSIEEAPNKITRSEAKWNSVILPYLANNNENREQEREEQNKKLSFLFCH